MEFFKKEELAGIWAFPGISGAQAGDFCMGRGRRGAWLQQKSQGCITIGHFGSHAYPSLTQRPVEGGEVPLWPVEGGAGR